jgi:starch synthase
MNIAMVSPEMVPFVKVGGLADVVSSLSSALHRRKKNVSVILPFYSGIDRQKFPARDTGKKVQTWMDGAPREASIWLYDFDGVQVVLLDHREFYGRKEIYGVGGSDYPDNAFRYAFLARAALEAVKVLGIRPDVFHIHDWQTSLLPVYRNTFYRDDASVGGAAIVLTIHNLAYQGTFDKEVMPRLGLPWDVFQIEGLEFHGKANLLKGGLLYSNLLTTVSPTYAKEIQTPESGAGLYGLLRSRSSDLVGILNGIDASLWNPASDEMLFENFDTENITGKAVNKQKLQEKLGLEPSESAPLFGCVARLDPQKGFDLVLEIAPQMLEEGAQLAILGSGWEEYVRGFRKLEKKYPKQLSMNEGFQPELAPKIYAGSDFFLMPSRFEPCGLGQMIALRYGTVPVVRRTGGLADTIIDLDEDPVHGNGFSFERNKAAELQKTIRRARAHFADERKWRELVVRAMRSDFSWTRSIDPYLKVYERAIQKARGGP